MSQREPGMAHVLIIVQNLPVPLDRRVWLEAQALTAAGYKVSVICPKGPGDPDEETIAGIDIYKYRPAPEADTFWGFACEFAYSWARTAALSLKVWRRNRFEIIQACNPPDTYWLLARMWRRRGVKFLFDQHDLNPELFLSRFGTPKGLARRLQQKALLWLEQQTYATADHVVSTNESYKAIAMQRGSLPSDAVTVVRSGPDTRAMRPIEPAGLARREGGALLVYLGVMGPQDNVDTLVDVVEELVRHRGRTEVRAALLGFGDCLEDLKQDVKRRGLEPWIEFTGRVGPEEIAEYLSSADLGLSPDRKTPLNDVSTMNKTMEYMAYGLPSVTFDLVETRVSAGDSALFVKDGDLKGFADAVELLVDDPELRVDLGLKARHRVETILDWRPQAHAYVCAFDATLGATRGPDMPELAPPARETSHSFVNLEDEEEFIDFMLTRGRPERAAGITVDVATMADVALRQQVATRVGHGGQTERLAKSTVGQEAELPADESSAAGASRATAFRTVLMTGALAPTLARLGLTAQRETDRDQQG